MRANPEGFRNWMLVFQSFFKRAAEICKLTGNAAYSCFINQKVAGLGSSMIKEDKSSISNKVLPSFQTGIIGTEKKYQNQNWIQNSMELEFTISVPNDNPGNPFFFSRNFPGSQELLGFFNNYFHYSFSQGH